MQALKLANDMFVRWNATLQTGNASAVAGLYRDDGVLLPTVSNQVSKPPGWLMQLNTDCTLRWCDTEPGTNIVCLR